MKSDEPDFLDLYQLEDDNYGIQIKAAGGHGKDRKIKISWSPILMFDREKPGIHYRNIDRIVTYKLYLGYGTTSEHAQNTLDIFSSLCQLEAQEDYLAAKARSDRKDMKKLRHGHSREVNPANYTFDDRIRV